MPLINNNDQQKHESVFDWTIIQISDTHLMDQHELDFVSMNPEQSFHEVMYHIRQEVPHIDAIIHTGDLAQVPVAETYARYLQFMTQLEIPHYQIPGNHDCTDIFPFHLQQDQAHILHYGAWSAILLNSAVKDKVDGWISEAQLQQLHQLLSEHPQQHILIACHHHPFAMESAWIDQHKLKNATHLMDVIAQHTNVKIVICGHVHQDSMNTWNNIQFLSTPSTSVQFKPHSQTFALDQVLPGYRVIRLKNNGEFETEVHRVALSQPQINVEISGY